MISILGRAAVLLALAACSVGAVTGLVAGARGSSSAWGWSRAMAYTALGAMLAAAGLMEYALITPDFSVAYAAQVGSRSVPLWVAIVSLWSALEGSILLWAVVLTAYVAAFAWGTRDRYPEHTPWALGGSHLVGIFFTFLVAGVANPFAPVSPVPLDGPGPNPLLQNHLLMVIHPPSLYLGYVGMSVPFGMGCAALLAGRIGPAWSQALRRWMLLPWGFLTAGIVLGGWWSYEVLGWGGYWAWDPVENASFLPWLTATAFLHSAIMMERRDQLKGWAISLLLATFLLTLLGTFMTRSGVFNSVHSFTQTPIGPVFLGFLAVCMVASLLLLALRIDALSPRPAEDAAVASRDTVFLLNNLAFSAFTFTVLLGTIYPLINEALGGQKLAVGEPYFNKMGVPLGMLIVFLMGVGPALPWGRMAPDAALRRLLTPTVSALLAAAVAAVLGARGALPLVSFGICGFALATTLREIHEPVRARARKLREPYPTALLKVAAQTRRRFGGYVVHLGVIVAAAAITGSSAFKQGEELTFHRSQPVEVMGYTLTYTGPGAATEEGRRISQIAHMAVRRNDRDLGELQPRINNYFATGMVIGTPAVRTSLREDLYLSVLQLDEEKAILSVIVQPLVVWLWMGGAIMTLGTLISIWPSRRRAAVAAPAAPASAPAEGAAK